MEERKSGYDRKIVPQITTLKPKSCHEIVEKIDNNLRSGEYTIYIDGEEFKVYCYNVRWKSVLQNQPLLIRECVGEREKKERESKMYIVNFCLDCVFNCQTVSDFLKVKLIKTLFERFIQLGKHVKIAINISITGAFG